MNLDPQTQETLLDLAIRMSNSAAPLLLVESRSRWKEIGGIVVGFKKAIRRLQYITDKELLQTSDEEYKGLLQDHDYLLSIEIPSDVEKLSYFPLDMRNGGSFTMGVSSFPWRDHNYDVFITMNLPGVLPHMIRILSNRGEYHEAFQ